MTRARKWTLGSVVTIMVIVGAVFTSGSATGINVWRIGSHETKFEKIDATIESNKIECDRKIEAIEAASDARLEAQRVRDVEQMKVLIQVKTNQEWMKRRIENGGNPD